MNRTCRVVAEAYCNDVHERLALYKRLASCETREALDAMREELVDRFGDLPSLRALLLDSHLLRILAKPVGVARIDATHEAVCCSSRRTPSVDAKKTSISCSGAARCGLPAATACSMEAKLPPGRSALPR